MAKEGQRRLVLASRERAVAGGGHAGRHEHLLHPRLRALEPRTVGAGPEHQLALGPEPIGQAVDQRHLGPDHEQVGVAAPRAARSTEPGMPGLPGVTTTSAVRASTSARACSRPPQPTTQTRISQSCTYCSRPGPMPTRLTGTPTCSSRKAR